MHAVPVVSFFLVISSASLLHAQNQGPAPLAKEVATTSVPQAAPEAAPLEVKVSAQVRLREEVQDGTFSAGDPSGVGHFGLTYLRNRATLSVRKGNLSTVFQAQDTRALGEAGTTADSEGLDLRQGTIKLEKLADSESWLEAGRMVLAYGDQRLIGHLEWVNQARTFDGGRLRIVPSDNSWVDAFWAVTRETKTDHNDQYFGGVYSSIQPNTNWTSEVYGLSLVDRLESAGEAGMGNSAFATIGTRQVLSHRGLKLRFEGAAQVGELNGDSLLAYGAVLNLAFTAKRYVEEPRIALEAIYGSGDTDATDGDQGTFQTLFPTNHLHYGYVDQAAWSNLSSLAVRADFKPFKKVKAEATYHHLRLSDAAGGWYHATGRLIRPGDAAASSHLGDEIDLLANWVWRPGLKLECGYGLFVPGAFVEDTGMSEVAHFGYLQLAASLK